MFGRDRRVKTPTLLQMEAAECGAAALGIVLAHYGRWVPLEVLRVACGVSRDGSKASNVVAAARSYGLVARGFRKEPQDLRQLRLPIIVHWNFDHFVVVDGFRPGRVHLNDPATGPRVVSAEEFDESFTGVVLAFEPGAAFQRGGRKPTLLPALVRRLAGFLVPVSYLVLAGLALVVLGLAIPAFSKLFVDNVLVRGQPWILPLLIGMTITALLRGVVTWLQQHYLLRLRTKLAVGTSSGFLWHVLRLPVEFFTQRFAGDITSRVAINERVAQLLAGDLANAALNIVVIGFYALLMFRYDALLTVVSVAIAAVNFLTLRYVSRRLVDQNQRVVTERGQLMSATMSGLQTIETIKAGGAESDFFARWAGYHAKLVNARDRVGALSEPLAAVPAFLTALNTTAILAVGGLRVMDGTLTMGTLVAFQTLMISFLMPVNQLVTLGGTLKAVEGDMNRLDDVLDQPVDAQAGEDDSASSDGIAPRLAGRLELKEVTFGYSRLEPPLIEALSLSLEPGDRVALVGASGSGKSTVAKLVGGTYAPWTGKILLDGRPRSSTPRRVITNSLAMVDQDVFLFEGTIRENLTLWDSTVPESDMVQAAKDALIHADISARHGGYDSPVAEGGANFSGGQRQRIELARALVGNPSILILDEATSALDALTEREIDDRLRRRGCTCVIVAHRLSTIRDCDEIIVLERGKVVQRGRHDEMISVDGPYARLIKSEAYEDDRRRSLLERL